MTISSAPRHHLELSPSAVGQQHGVAVGHADTSADMSKGGWPCLFMQPMTVWQGQSQSAC